MADLLKDCPLACAAYGCSDCLCWELTGNWHQCLSCNPETEECFELRKCNGLDMDTCTDDELGYCNWISDQANDTSGYCTDVPSSGGLPLDLGVIIMLAVLLGLCVVLLVSLYLMRRLEWGYGTKKKARAATVCVVDRRSSSMCQSKPRTQTVFIDDTQAKTRAVTVYCDSQDSEEEDLQKVEDMKKGEAESLSKLINHKATPIEKILDCDFENTPKIGEGSFGYVVKAIYANMEVALKRFKIPWTEWSDKEKKDFQMEIGEGLKLRHENIVRYFGWTEDPVSVIMELCPYGSLKDYFEWAHEAGKDISNETLLNWAIGAAKGITYLHSKHLVHRDIAARNLLLNKHLEIRVSDFGMSRKISSSEKDLGKTETSVGPLKWMPPESLREQEYSKKTDTYAFGITLWEIFSQGEEPYAGKSAVEAAFFALRSEQNRPSMASIPFTHVIPIMESCWRYLADDRPQMKDVAKRLSELRAWAKGNSISIQGLSDGASPPESGQYSQLNPKNLSIKSDRGRPQMDSNYGQSGRASGRSELSSNYCQSGRFSGRSEFSSNYEQAGFHGAD